ncbi:RES family NAD+ phosphorylase [Aliterella atlantica]|nr:RES family NAD+ phosphorylase [Aliterella atlantica]
MSVPTVRIKRRCWRMLAPKWAYRPLSGAGAALHGGRFNTPGREALYISEDYVTAISEYEQDLGIRPGTLCAYDVDVSGVVDLASPEVQAICGVNTVILACAWKQIWLIEKQRPPTWELAERLIAENYAGIRVPSVQDKSGVNIVLWYWNDAPNRHISVLDPRTDLPLDQSSWNV